MYYTLTGIFRNMNALMHSYCGHILYYFLAKLSKNNDVKMYVEKYIEKMYKKMKKSF